MTVAYLMPRTFFCGTGGACGSPMRFVGLPRHLSGLASELEIEIVHTIPLVPPGTGEHCSHVKRTADHG